MNQSGRLGGTADGGQSVTVGGNGGHLGVRTTDWEGSIQSEEISWGVECDFIPSSIAGEPKNMPCCKCVSMVCWIGVNMEVAFALRARSTLLVGEPRTCR